MNPIQNENPLNRTRNCRWTQL